MNNSLDQQLCSVPSFRVDSPITISAAVEASATPLDADNDDDFEFAVFKREEDSDVADKLFSNGRLLPLYPVFDQKLLRSDDRKRGSLGTLFMLERESDDVSSSTSSSEVDELEGVPEGTYCVWAPPTKKECKKSGSTRSAESSGSTSSSSLTVKLKELVIGRSSSDGKERFADKFMFAPKSEKKISGLRSGRKTYLPYKPDLVGLFSVNSISR